MLLSEKIRISTVAENTVKKAAADKSVNDLEVGMQYYAALNATCKCIITEDKGDFYFSKLETYTAEEFLIKYIKIIKG
jgi:hypothetical protein